MVLFTQIIGELVWVSFRKSSRKWLLSWLILTLIIFTPRS